MRMLPLTILLTLALSIVDVDAAKAIAIRLEQGTAPGQVDVFLDLDGHQTNGAPTQVLLINFGVQSNDVSVDYLGAEPPPTLPELGDEPGILLSYSPFGFLAPTPAFGQESVAPDVPPGETRVLIDYFTSGGIAGANGAFSGTENVRMATLNYGASWQAFELDLLFGEDGGFWVQGDGAPVDLSSGVALQNNIVIPEPTSGFLVALGLWVLGAARRRGPLPSV